MEHLDMPPEVKAVMQRFFTPEFDVPLEDIEKYVNILNQIKDDIHGEDTGSLWESLLKMADDDYPSCDLKQAFENDRMIASLKPSHAKLLLDMMKEFKSRGSHPFRATPMRQHERLPPVSSGIRNIPAVSAVPTPEATPGWGYPQFWFPGCTTKQVPPYHTVPRSHGTTQRGYYTYKPTTWQVSQMSICDAHRSQSAVSIPKEAGHFLSSTKENRLGSQHLIEGTGRHNSVTVNGVSSGITQNSSLSYRRIGQCSCVTSECRLESHYTAGCRGNCSNSSSDNGVGSGIRGNQHFQNGRGHCPCMTSECRLNVPPQTAEVDHNNNKSGFSNGTIGSASPPPLGHWPSVGEKLAAYGRGEVGSETGSRSGIMENASFIDGKMRHWSFVTRKGSLGSLHRVDGRSEEDKENGIVGGMLAHSSLPQRFPSNYEMYHVSNESEPSASLDGGSQSSAITECDSHATGSKSVREKDCTKKSVVGVGSHCGDRHATGSRSGSEIDGTQQSVVSVNSLGRVENLPDVPRTLSNLTPCKQTEVELTNQAAPCTSNSLRQEVDTSPSKEVFMTNATVNCVVVGVKGLKRNRFILPKPTETTILLESGYETVVRGSPGKRGKRTGRIDVLALCGGKRGDKRTKSSARQKKAKKKKKKNREKRKHSEESASGLSPHVVKAEDVAELEVDVESVDNVGSDLKDQKASVSSGSDDSVHDMTCWETSNDTQAGGNRCREQESVLKDVGDHMARHPSIPMREVNEDQTQSRMGETLGICRSEGNGVLESSRTDAANCKRMNEVSDGDESDNLSDILIIDEDIQILEGNEADVSDHHAVSHNTPEGNLH